MTVSKEMSWRQLIAKSDPEWARNSKVVTEYEFTAAYGGNDATHRNGSRIFEADYRTRGAYAPSPIPDDVLTVDGVPITIQGEFLTDNE